MTGRRKDAPRLCVTAFQGASVEAKHWLSAYAHEARRHCRLDRRGGYHTSALGFRNAVDFCDAVVPLTADSALT